MVTSMYSKVLQCGNLGVEKALFQAIFRAYNSRGKVFVPYPSSLQGLSQILCKHRRAV